MTVRSVQPLQILAALAVSCLGLACADPTTAYGEHPAVVCAAEAGSPLALRAQGTLTRTKIGNELRYRLNVKEHAYDWRFVTNDDKSTTIFGPGFLTGRLVQIQGQDKAPQFPRGPINAAERAFAEPVSQSLHINGEIRERSSKMQLWVGQGTKCPS
jgi:hypothetical protein